MRQVRAQSGILGGSLAALLHSNLGRQLRNARVNKPQELQPQLLFDWQPRLTLPQIALKLRDVGT